MSEETRRFQNPEGERLIFRQTGAETNGELLEMEATYVPHSPQPPLHYHPVQEEQFEVLRGTFQARIGDAEHTYQAGDKFTVPPNTPHWMHNISDEEGCLRWEIRPALNSQDFFATMWGLAADQENNPQGRPNFLHLVVILSEFTQEFRASSPPFWIQQILFGLIAPLGRLLGYKAY